MLELLKKIGIPATVAAVIASLVTVVPFLFQIDERYAKTGELNDVATKSAKQVQDLTVEVSKLAGVQETMLAMMMQSDRRAALAPQPTTVMVPTTVLPTPAPTPALAPVEMSPAECARLKAAGFKCMGTDEAPAPAPKVLSAPAPRVVQVPVKIAPAKSPDELRELDERKKMFESVSSALKHSQEKLSAIQKY